MTEPAKKKSIKKEKKLRRKKERKEVNHPVCQWFLCWLNSWILLVKEHRHCLTGLNPGAQQGWGQLCPRCHLCCRGEKRGRCSPQPLWGWLLTQSTSRVPRELCPAPSAGNEHGDPRPFGRGAQSFPLSCLILLQQPVPRSCGAASHLWERLWKSYCCSCLKWWSGEGSHTAPWIFITKTKALVLSPSPVLCTSNPCTMNNNVRKRGADRETD